MNSTNTPPGWYPDSQNLLRWWDGTQWTENVASTAPQSTAGIPSRTDRTEPRESRKASRIRWISVLNLTGFLPVIMIAAVAWVIISVMFGETPSLEGSGIEVVRRLALLVAPLTYLWMFIFSFYVWIAIGKKEILGTSIKIINTLNTVIPILGMPLFLLILSMT